MAHNYIIQWNCRGLRSNREDIELLISKYSPAAICLQETLLTPYQTQTFKHYSAYYKSGIHGHGGVCILVKDKFIHSQVQFQADLQAVAVCITINKKTYTVASVYVPPNETLNELAFDRMINSFSSRYLILDFNGHSNLWGANQENERGKIVEKLIDCHNLILLNDSVHTRFDTYHQTSSLLDLEHCQAANKARNKTNRLANKHPSAANSMRARLFQARTKKLFKQQKRDSWKNYVSSVNVNTPSKKVCDMIRKITGKNVASPMHHLKDDNGTLITDRVEIANTLGAAIEKSSFSNNYS